MTSSSDPDQIRADIERTRAALSSDVNTLAYEANPTTMAKRKVGRVTSSLRTVRERVMGSASDTAESTSQAKNSAIETISGTAQSAGDAVQSAPSAVKAQTQGNPLAAGLIAFGAGLLVAALIPASEREQQTAAALQEKAQPLTDAVTDMAKQTAENLQEPVQEAVAAVKDTATDAAASVKDEGTSAAQDVQDHAQQAGSAVADQQR